MNLAIVRAGLLAVIGVIAHGAQAQPWGSPYGRSNPYVYRQAPQPGYYFPPWGWDDDDEDGPMRRGGPEVASGGERPTIAAIGPKTISFPSTFPVNSVVIDTSGRQLLLITSPTQALHYPISVGREGFAWTGRETISRKAQWPDWYPPVEMRERDWRLPEKMTGGMKNPLGAMALYLGSSLYRIHGTNDAKSIGRAASSGCFRMLNGHIIDLASRVDVGTIVTVVGRLPPDLARLVADQVAPHPAEAKQRVNTSQANPN
jgi:lipoprotein-anchoring transpeptidase ErfK/SrfK